MQDRTVETMARGPSTVKAVTAAGLSVVWYGLIHSAIEVETAKAAAQDPSVEVGGNEWDRA
jgi:hypothetical protein